MVTAHRAQHLLFRIAGTAGLPRPRLPGAKLRTALCIRRRRRTGSDEGDASPRSRVHGAASGAGTRTHRRSRAKSACWTARLHGILTGPRTLINRFTGRRRGWRTNRCAGARGNAGLRHHRARLRQFGYQIGTRRNHRSQRGLAYQTGTRARTRRRDGLSSHRAARRLSGHGTRRKGSTRLLRARRSRHSSRGTVRWGATRGERLSRTRKHLAGTRRGRQRPYRRRHRAAGCARYCWSRGNWRCCRRHRRRM